MTTILRGDRCRCAACGLYFNSTRAFDAHRRGPADARRCLTETELRAAGYTANAAGFWRKAMSAAGRCAMRGVSHD